MPNEYVKNWLENEIFQGGFLLYKLLMNNNTALKSSKDSLFLFLVTK